jgi:hypothetical protein
MPRLLVFLALLLPTLVRAAETATVPWHRAPAAAAAVARAQQKMLLVYYVGDCGRCSAASDAMFENAASDEIFKTVLDSFLPLRVDASTAAHPIVDALRQQKKAPVLAIYDTDGVQLQALSGDDLRWNKVGELLLRFRAARPLVAAAAEFRQSGNSGAVSYALGEALMAAREPKRAAEQYDRAAKLYGTERPQDRQYSEIMAGYARFASGQQKLGRHEVTRVLRAALSDAIAAEAHFRLGAMSEASLRKSVTVPSTPAQGAPISGRRTRSVTHPSSSMIRSRSRPRSRPTAKPTSSRHPAPARSRVRSARLHGWTTVRCRRRKGSSRRCGSRRRRGRR